MGLAGPFCETVISYPFQIASCIALDSAIYSVSAVDSAIGLLFALPAAPAPICNPYQDVDFRWSSSQSAPE